MGGAALVGEEGRDGRNFWRGGVVEHNSQEMGWEEPYLGHLGGKFDSEMDDTSCLRG